MAVIPNAPVSVTADSLAALLNLKADGEAQRVLDLAVAELNRELTGAFRDMPQNVYDDAVRRVAGAIVGSKRRPGGGNGQLTRTEQESPAPTPRDYLAPVRQTLALYVAPL